MIVLGVDPGGTSGAAIWRIDTKPVTSSHKSVDSALRWFKERLEGQHPTAAGIDTLLCWETGPGGWRKADLLLRENYKRVQRSIIAPNALYGAMAVQGMGDGDQLAAMLAENQIE